MTEREKTIRKLGENAADAAKEYATTIAQLSAENEKMREALDYIKTESLTFHNAGHKNGASYWRSGLEDVLRKARTTLKELSQ